MEGPFFCALDPHERLEVIPRLKILARSSLKDKTLLEIMARINGIMNTCMTKVEDES